MEIRDRIQQALDAQGMSYRAASLKADLSDSMVHKFMTRQTHSITVDNLEKLANAMGVSLRWIMFGDEHDREKVVSLWDRMPESRRELALDVLERFARDANNHG